MWLLFWSSFCLLQAKRKFIIMCVIIRLSVTLQRSENMDLQRVEFLESSESFKLVSNFFFYHSISYQFKVIVTWNSWSLPPFRCESSESTRVRGEMEPKNHLRDFSFSWIQYDGTRSLVAKKTNFLNIIYCLPTTYPICDPIFRDTWTKEYTEQTHKWPFQAL